MTVEDLRLAPEQQLQQQQEHHQQHLPVSQDQEDSQESPTSSLDPSDKQLQVADSCRQLLQLLSTDKKEEEQLQGDLWWPEQLMVG